MALPKMDRLTLAGQDTSVYLKIIVAFKLGPSCDGNNARKTPKGAQKPR